MTSIETPYFHTGTHFIEEENCEKCGGNPIQCDPTRPCEKDTSLEMEVRKHLVAIPYAYKRKKLEEEPRKGNESQI